MNLADVDTWEQERGAHASLSIVEHGYVVVRIRGPRGRVSVTSYARAPDIASVFASAMSTYDDRT